MSPIKVIIIVIGCLFGAYVLGRLFSKGFLKELDLFLGRKFVNHINNKKQKENDNEEKK
jgi:hypothetical protein